MVYERATGQQVNRQKTSFFFKPNTPKEIQEYVKQRFGADIIRQHDKYLGLPSLVGWNKRNTFQQLKEREAHKLSGWKEKFLSMAGKEVLIKAVVQAIPNHTMSCFLLPKSLCAELNSMVTFGGDRKMMSVKWPGWSGKSCVLQRQMVGWDLETWGLSTLPF